MNTLTRVTKAIEGAHNGLAASFEMDHHERELAEAFISLRALAKVHLQENGLLPSTVTNEVNDNMPPATPAPAQTTQHGANALSLADMEIIATEIGELHGKAEDGQIRFLVKCVEAAHVGAVDTQKNKHGDGIDDATKLTAAYVKGRTGASVFNHKAPNHRKTCSTTRCALILGQFTKGGPSEPLTSTNKFLTVWRELRAKNVAIFDAANAFLKYARLQVKRNSMITEAEMRNIIMKPAAAHVTEEQWLENLRKSAEKAIDKITLDSTTAQAIRQLCTKRLVVIAKGKGAPANPPNTPLPDNAVPNGGNAAVDPQASADARKATMAAIEASAPTETTAPPVPTAPKPAPDKSARMASLTGIPVKETV